MLFGVFFFCLFAGLLFPLFRSSLKVAAGFLFFFIFYSNHAMLLVGVLWVLPKLPLALLFSEGAGLLETGCRLAPKKGQPGET